MMNNPPNKQEPVIDEAKPRDSSNHEASQYEDDLADSIHEEPADQSTVSVGSTVAGLTADAADGDESILVAATNYEDSNSESIHDVSANDEDSNLKSLVAAANYEDSNSEPVHDAPGISGDSNADSIHAASAVESAIEKISEIETTPADPEARARNSGFRLKTVEVYNWGTFNGQVWKLELEGKNALLTGNNGSGKSTFVDAITTLLYPANKAAYNKAAGADTKERTLRSYVMGFYKSERSETDTGRGSKPVALRDHNNYSVILGVFYNADYDQTVTLAQVFWMKDPTGMPARHYVVAEKSLSISEDFAKFGTEISKLNKKLRAAGCEIFDAFTEYGAWYRRRFGIASEQAMDLFHQTVSMKSVGNLTDFVRNHMLEPFDVKSRIQALIDHFDDLNSLHEAVLKAEQQIKQLTPLVEDCRNLGMLKQKSDELRLCRDALKVYFANLKYELLGKRVAALTEDWSRLNNQILKSEAKLVEQKINESKLLKNIADNGGDRIDQLRTQIRQKEVDREKKKLKAHRYEELVNVLGWTVPNDAQTFEFQIRTFESAREAYETKIAEIQNELSELSLRLRQGRDEHKALSDEIVSLKSRRSNIPRAQITIRSAICSALKFSEDELPFAGELLKVRDEELDWEGAAERVMRNFGLSLLVPDRFYEEVANWVDKTHLKDRLVYFRIRGKQRTSDFPSRSSNSLFNKISIKPDSDFYDWIEREIAHRFNHVCCESQEEFRRQTVAITRTGQLKSAGEKHEKDDRHHIADRSRYVLGWSNAAKIEALENQLTVLEHTLGKIAAEISSLMQQKNELEEKQKALAKLEEYIDFGDIDWQSLVVEIDALLKEKEELEAASDLLLELTKTLNSLQAEMKELERILNEQRDKRSKTEQKKTDAENLLSETEAFIRDPLNEKHSKFFEKLEAVRGEALGEHTLTVESCFNREQDMREFLQVKIDSEDKKARALEQRIVGSMQKYNGDFPLDTQEVNAHLDSADEYAKMLAELQSNALPRFKEKFKQMLNENAINEVANFQSQLHREREVIKERIAYINKSLAEIKFTADTYILLEATTSGDAEIRDFQSELKTCTEGTLTGSEDEEYSEAKFLEVKRIIERFRGREGTAEMDKRWTERVTDVRNWYTFAASERWVEDNKEKEHYSDSSGKSGGQKEKLAYTILAASLAYQFGLELGALRSRTFRFVVIDEAFGRGSDDSARYGLILFAKLGLQLLVVTPMQKIDVIAPYVNSVGFVNNENGNNSKLRNLSIEEYIAEQAQRLFKKESDLA